MFFKESAYAMAATKLRLLKDVLCLMLTGGIIAQLF